MTAIVLQRISRNLEESAALMDEASIVLGALPKEVLDTLKVRYNLADELYGYALVARESATSLKEAPR